MAGQVAVDVHKLLTLQVGQVLQVAIMAAVVFMVDSAVQVAAGVLEQ
jgi:hypothetical protein